MEKNLSYEPGRLSENERSRLSILKLISIIFVVYIHSYANVINFRDSKIDLSDFYLVQKIELLFSNRIACFAVPLFFCISGYIFFKKNYK